MLEKGYRFDAFKIGCNNYLLITLIIPIDKKSIKYEILGDKGTYVKRRIDGCDRKITISQEVNLDETLVFRYKINEDFQFIFIKYNELIKPKVNKMSLDNKNCYIIQKNIHMNVNYHEGDTHSSKDELEFYEESSEEDEGDDCDDMYKPISDIDEADDEDGIMNMFHLEDDDKEDSEEADFMSGFVEGETIDTGWSKPEPIKTNVIEKKEGGI